MDISKVAYELYKQDWIDAHTTPEMRLESLRDYFDYLLDCAEEGYDGESYEVWLDDVGYGQGSLYVCYEEFCDMEYHDVEYIKGLLGADELFEMYCKDIGIAYVEGNDLDVVDAVLASANAKAQVIESCERDFHMDL